MNTASQELNFEAAAEFRNQINYIEQTVEKQSIVFNDDISRDFFNFHVDGGWIAIQVLFVRHASLRKREVAMYQMRADENEELLEYMQQYDQKTNNMGRQD